MFERPASGERLSVAHRGARIEARCTALRRDVDPAPLPLDVDARDAGRCTSLRVADVRPALHALGGGAAPALEGPTALDGGEYWLRLDGPVTAALRFAGPATVDPDDGGVSVSFPAPTRVTVGLCVRRREPAETVTVPPTASGVATAVTVAGASHRTTGPERSLPGLRRHPPAVELGPRDVPEALSSATPDTGIEFAVPDDLGDALVIAPLVRYLGANLTVDAGSRPRLRAPSVGIDRVLAPLPEVASAMLRRVFFLDCLVRPSAYPGSADGDLLTALDLDAAALRRASPAERLRAYLDAPVERIDADLPAWHLATYVEPDGTAIRCLPALLDRRSLLYPAETEPLAGRELVEQSLDDFYRGEGRVEVEKPILRRGALHGWLAPSTPIDVFDSHPRAYEHRPVAADDGFQVVVVTNEDEMVGEDGDAAAAYRSRETNATVSVRRDLSRRALADVFAADVDLVHYVGHCDEEGLRCADGHLRAGSLSDVSVGCFFLNACGSYREGRALVRAGSVAGAVTFRDVLDGQATTVGTTFARLLVQGFCVERALRLARRRIRMGKDYAAVGDATYAPAGDGDAPILVRVHEGEEGYEVSVEGMPDDAPGGVFRPPLDGTDGTLLRGREAVATVDRAELRAALSGTGLPVIHDGGFAWAETFLEGI